MQRGRRLEGGVASQRAHAAAVVSLRLTSICGEEPGISGLATGTAGVRGAGGGGRSLGVITGVRGRVVTRGWQRRTDERDAPPGVTSVPHQNQAGAAHAPARDRLPAKGGGTMVGGDCGRGGGVVGGLGFGAAKYRLEERHKLRASG